jgi:hypothetical protein
MKGLKHLLQFSKNVESVNSLSKVQNTIPSWTNTIKREFHQSVQPQRRFILEFGIKRTSFLSSIKEQEKFESLPRRVHYDHKGIEQSFTTWKDAYDKVVEAYGNPSEKLAYFGKKIPKLINIIENIRWERALDKKDYQELYNILSYLNRNLDQFTVDLKESLKDKVIEGNDEVLINYLKSYKKFLNNNAELIEKKSMQGNMER